MGVRTSTTLDFAVGFENSLDNKAFGGDSVLSELLDTLDHVETGVYALAGGEQDTPVDFGDVAEARLVYLEGDAEFEAVFGGSVATAGELTGSGGSYPTGFVGGETLNLKIDGVAVAVVFDAADQTLVQVLARVNYYAALLSIDPVAEAAAGEMKLVSPTVGSGSSVEVVSGTAMATLGLSAATGTGQNAAAGTSNLVVSRPADPAGASAAAGVKAYLLSTLVTTSIRLTNPHATNGVRIKTCVVGDLISD